VKLIAQVSLVIAFALVLLIVATVWATRKSIERTECYRSATSIDQCEQPGPVEDFIRRTLGGFVLT
jgi:hypothetical protein